MKNIVTIVFFLVLSLPILASGNVTGKLPAHGQAIEVLTKSDFEVAGQPQLYGQTFLWREVKGVELHHVLIVGDSIPALDELTHGPYLFIALESDEGIGLTLLRVDVVD